MHIITYNNIASSIHKYLFCNIAKTIIIQIPVWSFYDLDLACNTHFNCASHMQMEDTSV